MTERITEPHIDSPLAVALSDYMLSVSGRRPTRGEMWDIYWAAVDAIEKAAGAAAP